MLGFFHDITKRIQSGVCSQRQRSSLTNSYLRKQREFHQHPQEPGKPETQTRTQAAAPSCEGAEMTRALLPFDLRSSSPPENHQVGS